MFETCAGPVTSSLEDRIVDTAGRMAAAQCRWLLDLADLDTHGGVDSADYASTAAWLSWCCGLQSHQAKEYVAVACALKSLPRITDEFSRGRLSYSQVRMLARVATGQTEQTLIDISRNSTVNQLSLVVGRYRSLLDAETATRARHRGRCLSTWFDAEGFFVLRGRLCPEDGAVVEAALQRAMSSMETSSPLEATIEKAPGHVHHHHGARQADALVEVARLSLSPGSSGRQPAALPEMIVHIELDPAAGGLGEDCHLECGVPLAPETALRLSCDAPSVPLIEDPDGNPLSVGRRTRSIPAPLRRALHARDRGCCFPGCTNRVFVEAHHIRHWSRGGHTCLDNLTELCRFHHRLVHEGCYTVISSGDGFEFYRRDGTMVPRARDQMEYSDELPGIATEPRAICSEWLGDPMNLGYVIGALFDAEKSEKDGISR